MCSILQFKFSLGFTDYNSGVNMENIKWSEESRTESTDSVVVKLVANCQKIQSLGRLQLSTVSRLTNTNKVQGGFHITLS